MSISKCYKIICFLLFLLIVVPFSGQALASEEDDSDWTIYFYPGVRWGTDSRTIFVLDFLVPLYQGEKNIFFANTKFSPNDKDGFEMNLGLGYRHLILDDKLILGLNTFYDRRRTEWGSHHDQWGVGVEAMTEWVTGRFNYYYPLSDAKIGGPFGYMFQGNGIYAGGMEEPLKGFDYEVGFKIPYISNYLETWAYAGGYHFTPFHFKDVNGFSTRLEIIPTDFFCVNFEYRNDNINHSEFYGEVAFEVPFSIENLVSGKNPFEGIGSRFGGSRPLEARLTDPVRRDVDIVVLVEEFEPGSSDAGKGQLLEEVIFVSEDAENILGSQDGTFEHPWESVNAALWDPRLGSTTTTIHVINDDAGSGYALGSGDETLGLSELLIWGSGVNHPRYPNISNLTSGYPDVCEFLGTDSAVLILNEPNTTVMGLMLSPSADVGGILVNNGTGLVITRNEIGSGVENAYGIYSWLFDIGDIGSPTLPAEISYNSITVNTVDPGDYGDSIGIFLGADNIYADIFENDIYAYTNATNPLAVGIGLMAANNIGTAGSPVDISANVISSIAAGPSYAYAGYAYGILLSSGFDFDPSDPLGTISPVDAGNIYSSIAGNEMEVSGGLASLGITEMATENFDSTVTGNEITSGGGFVNLGITGVSLYPIEDMRAVITDNILNLEYSAIASGITLFSGANCDLSVADNEIYGDGVYAALGITAISGGDLYSSSTGVTGNTIEIGSAGLSSGILLGPGGENRVDITDNIMGSSVYSGLLGLGITSVSLFGDIETDISRNSLNVIAEGNDLPVGDILDLFGFPTGLGDYNIGIASGIFVGSLEGDIYARITENTGMYIDGTSLAGGITVGSVFGSLGSDDNPLFIDGNEMFVSARGEDYLGTQGDLDQLVVDLLDGVFSLGIGDLGDLNLDGVGSGIALFTGDELYATVSSNYIEIEANLAALGITGIGYDVGIGNPVVIDNNTIFVEPWDGDIYPYVSSGILLAAINRMDAEITNNHMLDYDLYRGIIGEYVALGITALSLNIDDDGNSILVSGNEIGVDSYGLSSGILLGSLNNLNPTVTDNLVITYSNYASLGITAFAGDDLGYGSRGVVSENSLFAYSGYLSSGILLGAGGDLSVDVTNNNMYESEEYELGVGGGLAALGITVLSYDGDIDTNISGNDMYVDAWGTNLDLGFFGLDEYYLGFASGVFVGSLYGDIFGSVTDNDEIDVYGRSLAGGITVATYDGVIGSGIDPFLIDNNILDIEADGYGDFNLLLADIFGEDIGIFDEFGLEGTALGITLASGGSDPVTNSAIFSHITNNDIDVMGDSIGIGSLLFAYDGDIGSTEYPVVIGNIVEGYTESPDYTTIGGGPNTFDVNAEDLAVGIMALAGLDPFSDPSTGGSTTGSGSIFMHVIGNNLTIGTELDYPDYAMAGFFGASDLIGYIYDPDDYDDTTDYPFLFLGNSGSLYADDDAWMLNVVGLEPAGAFDRHYSIVLGNTFDPFAFDSIFLTPQSRWVD